jgi:hypothetical protein
MITFTIALHENTIFTQRKTDSFFQEIENPTNLLASNSSFAIEKDTSEILFFSFEKGEAVPFYRKFVNTEDSKTSTAYVCENNNIVLSTPDFGQDAIYSWKGPAGFTSLSQQIILEKITPFSGWFLQFHYQEKRLDNNRKSKADGQGKTQSYSDRWTILFWGTCETKIG